MAYSMASTFYRTPGDAIAATRALRPSPSVQADARMNAASGAPASKTAPTSGGARQGSAATDRLT